MKGLAATDAVKTKIAVKKVDYYIRLSKMNTTIDPVFMESER